MENKMGVVYNVHMGEEVISATAEHPFWVHEKGFVEARELVKGDELFVFDDNYDRLEESEKENNENFKVVEITNITKNF
jgi:hypothetical protein